MTLTALSLVDRDSSSQNQAYHEKRMFDITKRMSLLLPGLDIELDVVIFRLNNQPSHTFPAIFLPPVEVAGLAHCSSDQHEHEFVLYYTTMVHECVETARTRRTVFIFSVGMGS